MNQQKAFLKKCVSKKRRSQYDDYIFMFFCTRAPKGIFLHARFSIKFV